MILHRSGSISCIQSMAKLASLFLSSLFMATVTMAQNSIPFSDDFSSRTLSDPDIGNNWTWYDVGYSDAMCTTGNETGGYGPYSGGTPPPPPYVHPNNNFTNCGATGACYYRAGIVEPTAGNFALDVYGNQYSSAGEACSQVNIFQEFASTPAGDYRLTATVQANEFVPIDSPNRVGVFFKVLKSSDSSYATLQYTKQLVSVPASGTQAVSFDFTVDAANSGELVQVGFYNETTPASRNASAWWDNVAVNVAPPTTSGGSGSSSLDPNAVPALPPVALILLSVLAAWMGRRQLRNL